MRGAESPSSVPRPYPAPRLGRIATPRAPLVPCAYIAVRSCQGRAHAHGAAPEDAGAMRHTGTGRFGDWQPVTYLVRTSDVASGAELWFERAGFRLPWPFCDPAWRVDAVRCCRFSGVRR